MIGTRLSDPRDAFLDELGREFAFAAEDCVQTGLSCLSAALPACAPKAGLRARVLEAAQAHARLERYAHAVAGLLDLRVDQAAQLLARLSDASVWTEQLPGIRFFWVGGGPAVANALRGFVWIAAGARFPEHEHLGEEHALVLQGAYEDTTLEGVIRSGAILHMPADSSHALRALPDGPDLLKLAVIQRGMRLLGRTLLPR